MPDDTVKLGSMEIEIITNAKKAEGDIQSMSKTGIFAVGALGGVVGVLGTSFLGFANNFVRQMPGVNTEISKYGDAIEIIAMNTDRALGISRGDSLGDALLKYSMDKTIFDVLEDIVTGGGLSREREAEKKMKDAMSVYEEFITPEPSTFIGPMPAPPSMARTERQGVMEQYLGGGAGQYDILSAQAGYQPGTPGYSSARPIDTSGFGGGTNFGQGTQPVINVFLDGKMLDSKPTYIGY